MANGSIVTKSHTAIGFINTIRNLVSKEQDKRLLIPRNIKFLSKMPYTLVQFELSLLMASLKWSAKRVH